MNIKYTKRLTLAGFLSGILSFLVLTTIVDLFFLNVFLLPGIYFGITLAFAMYFLKKKLMIVRAGLWIVISALAYFISVSIVWPFLHGIQTLYIMHIFLLAGVIGGSIVSLAFLFLFAKFKIVDFVMLLIFSCILSLSWYILPPHGFEEEYMGVLAPNLKSSLGLYIVWQAGMAAIMGYILDQRRAIEFSSIKVPPPLASTLSSTYT